MTINIIRQHSFVRQTLLTSRVDSKQQIEMASSSSNHVEEFAYPSHVCAPNFVTVKLSGRDMFGMWKTQMLCLLESSGMLSFIYERSPSQNSNHVLWRRSDALVKGWILGSLSEQTLRYVVNLLNTSSADFTAKDIWDKLQNIYGPTLLQHAVAGEEEEETITIEAESIIQVNPLSEEEIRKEAEKKKKEAEEKAKVHQSLYEAILTQNFDKVAVILRNREITVTVTDKITINGNTALHIAVGTTKKTKFLRQMLEEMADKSTLLDMRNADGSTLLHVAAIVGNTDAAKILVEINHELLFSEDKEGQTPLSRALSNMHTYTYLFLLNTMNTRDVKLDPLFLGTSGDELLVNAISANDYYSAFVLSERYRNLNSDSVLMAIAQNFPRKRNIWERMTYACVFEDPTVTLAAVICVLLMTPVVVSGFKWKIAFKSSTTAILVILFAGAVTSIVLRIKFVRRGYYIHKDATTLLKIMCKLIRNSKDSSPHHSYYTNPVLEATRQNAYEVVVLIVSSFPNAIWSTNEDGHNIIQYAVINRSEKVYNLLYQMSEHKNVYKTIRDPFGNNLLHLAARLAPTSKLSLISGAVLQIQRELQWFKEVEGFVCPLNRIQRNSFGETPKMVFTREHRELVSEGEKWMKATAESYTITAALITTIVFAAAITVPGGNNQDTGIPVFSNDAFTIFAISDAISLFTSTTSLLMFLSILTTRFAEEDFLFNLPTKLIIGLSTLFISMTAMIVAFSATLFLVFGQRNSWILIPIAALSCLPITSFATLQFPLIADLMSSTYGRSVFGKKRNRSFY
ncbi:ankyrin repeat-containing protein NPR4-like protein [Tanacetum coccineum]